jgi:lipoprotein-anchoring transpeptidase ErfK/SrfK
MKRYTKKINRNPKNKTKKQFLYNPDDPKKSFDVYIDKNPADTIHIKYKTIEDVESTIDKLEKLYKAKKYTHKRIWQVGMIMKVRLKVLQNKKPKQYALANRYFKFLGNRTKLDQNDRYNATFEYKKVNKQLKK